MSFPSLLSAPIFGHSLRSLIGFALGSLRAAVYFDVAPWASGQLRDGSRSSASLFFTTRLKDTVLRYAVCRVALRWSAARTGFSVEFASSPLALTRTVPILCWLLVIGMELVAPSLDQSRCVG